MDFNKQRKIVKRLEEKGRNPLLFLPCFIAKYAVIVFMTLCRLADMALSDKDGNFLGIKRRRKRKKRNYDRELAELQRRAEAEEALRAQAAAAAVSAESADKTESGRDGFSEKELRRLEGRLSYRPMWQRAVSALLAASFAVMTVPEISAGAVGEGVVYMVPVTEIVTSEMVASAGGGSKAAISEVDFSNYIGSGIPLKIEAGAFYNMPALTTVTMPAVTLGYSIGANNFKNIAHCATMFVSASTDEDYTTAAAAFRSTDINIVRDKGGIKSMIPDDVKYLNAYSAANSVLLEWPAVTNADGYTIYSYSGSGAAAVYRQVTGASVTYGDDGLMRAEIRASASSGDVLYAVRGYKTVPADAATRATGVTLYSKHFRQASSAVRPLITGTPTIVSNMINNTINLTISMPASASIPSYLILYSRSGDEDTYYGSYEAVFEPTDFIGNTVTWSNTYPLEKIVQKFIAVAYYDMDGSYRTQMMNQYPEKGAVTTPPNSAEISLFYSNEIAITEAILAPVSGLTCKYQSDREYWALHWSYPEGSNGMEGSIYYIITANNQVVGGYSADDRYSNTYAFIRIDDPAIEPGEDIIFSVTAVHDNMTSSAPASVSVDVRSNCVNLTAANPGDERVTLVFKKYPGATRYIIWYRQEFQNETGETVISEPKSVSVREDQCFKNSDGTLSYIVSNLTNDIPYTFWITSPAAMYRSVYRTVTPSNAPAPPQNVTATVFENGAEINWDIVYKDGTDEAVDGYYIEIRSRSGEVVIKNTQVQGRNTFTATKLQNDVEYYAYVYSYILVDGNPIQSRTYTRSDVFVPTVTVDNVLNLTAVDSGTYIKLTWSPVKNATKYMLYRTGEDGSSLTLDMGNKTSYDDKAVRNNVLYTYTVRAIRTVDNKDYEGEISSPQTQKINVVLSPVQGLTATGIDGGITLKWDKVNGADGYYVYYRTENGTEWTRAATVGTTTFTHTGIPNGTTYVYCIIPYAVVNAEPVPAPEDLSAIGVAQKVIGTAGLYLPAPSDFTATAGDGQVTLTWTAVSGADGYEIYIIGPNGMPYLYDNVSKTPVIHSGVANGTTITYTIRAYKYVDGNKVAGDYSVYRTVTVGTVLNAPTDVAAKAGDGQVSLSWKKVNGADGYVVYCYNSAGSSFSPVGIVTTTTFVHTGLTNGRTYTYMIAAYKNVAGEPQYSGYSLAVSAVPSGNGTGSGSSGGSGSSSRPDNNSNTSDYRIYITGTTPYGMSNSNLISAYAERGAFNNDIDVRFTLSPDTVTAVQNILNFYGEGIDSFMIYPMDISLYLAGTDTKTFINSGYFLTLTVPVPDDLLPYSESISVVHVSDQEQIEILPSVHVNVSGVDCIQFIANSFSPYAFVVYLPVLPEDTGAGTAASASGSVEYQTTVSPVFLCTYLPEIYRRRARNRVYRMIKRH